MLCLMIVRMQADQYTLWGTPVQRAGQILGSVATRTASARTG
jgi:hypothetical protein